MAVLNNTITIHNIDRASIVFTWDGCEQTCSLIRRRLFRENVKRKRTEWESKPILNEIQAESISSAISK